LDYWLGEIDPVVLVRYDAQDDKAYWVDIQEYFSGETNREGTKKTNTVYFDPSIIVDKDAIIEMARRKNRRIVELQAFLKEGGPDA